MTHTAVVYVACTEGRGLSSANEISAGANLPVAANSTLKVAYKRSQEEDSVVALQIVKDCLKLAERATTSGTERTAARKYQQQATRYIGKAKQGLPDIALDPSGTLDCGSADVGAPVSCQDVTIKSTGWAALHITRVEKTGAYIDDFTVGDECVDNQLAPGESCRMTVGFNPSAAGTRTATLVIHQNIPLPDHGTPLQLVGTGNGGPLEGHTLTVTVDTSTAAGGVVSSPSGIDCRDTCTGTFDDGADVTLTPTYDQGSGQISWDGCDTTVGDSCLVHLTADRAVTAHLLT